jgi:hypothetical protein
MTIEHNAITDPNRHEPKGISTASANQVYAATGGAVDGGTWKDMQPVGADTATEGEVYVSDGAGGGSWQNRGNIHGEMVIKGFTSALTLTASSDSTLDTDSDYIKVTAPSMWEAGVLGGVTFNADELVVPVDGIYEVNFWAAIETSVTNTLVGIKYSINDSTPYSDRKILSKSKVAGDVETVTALGYVSGLTASDTLSFYIAADTNTNVTIKEAGVTLKLLKES